MEELDLSGLLDEAGVKKFNKSGLGLDKLTPLAKPKTGDLATDVLADLSIDGWFGEGLDRVQTPQRKADLAESAQKLSIHKFTHEELELSTLDTGKREAEHIERNIVQEIKRMLSRIVHNATRFDQDGLNVIQDYQTAADLLIKNVIITDHPNNQDELLAYLEAVNAFLEDMSMDNLSALLMLCKNLSLSMQTQATALQLQTLRLTFLFFHQLSNDRDPIKPLSNTLFQMVNALNESDDLTKKHAQFGLLYSVALKWIEFIKTIQHSRNDSIFNYFDDLIEFYSSDTALWSNFLVEYASLGYSTHQRQKMLFSIRIKQLENLEGLDTEQLVKHFSIAWECIVDDLTAKGENERTRILQAIKTTLEKYNKPNDEAIDQEFKTLTRYYTKHDSKLMRGVGIALIAVGIALALLAAALMLSQIVPNLSVQLVPKLISDYFLATSITTASLGVSSAVIGGVMLKRGQSTDESKAFKNLFTHFKNDHGELASDAESDNKRLLRESG